jgi:hypothetical protein
MASIENVSNALSAQQIQPTILGISPPAVSLDSPFQTWKPQSAVRPNLQSAPLGNPRCSERACVFPARAGAGGRCAQHDRQNREPSLFSSHQPTHVVLERGRFDVPETEIDISRFHDRRKLAALREAFLEDGGGTA